MAGTKVNAATLINTVKYESDRASLRRVRKELRALKEMSSKNSVAQAKASVKAAQDAADSEIKAQKSVIQFNKQQERKGRGRGPLSNKTYDPKTVDRQNRAMTQAAQRSVSERLREQERIAKAQAKTRQEALHKDLTATMQLRKTAFDINRTQGLGIGDRYKAIQQAREITQAYREGRVELSEQNEQLRQLRLNTSAQARQARKVARQSGNKPKRGSSNFISTGATLGEIATGLGLAGLTYSTVNRSREALNSSIERQRGRQMQKTMGLDPMEGQALSQTILQQTGQNFSAEKLADISKDVQDKVGQLSQGSWKQNAKTKEWNFSGGGELTDWLNIMTTRGGYGRDEAVKTLQNAKGPVQFALILENLRKSAKLTDSEFTSLAEVVNDFSYVAKSIGPGAENVVKNLDEIARSGLALTDQQQRQIESLTALANVTKTVSDNLQDNFAASFSKGLNDAGITASKLQDDLSELRPIVRQFGEDMGSITGGLLNLLKYIPGSKTYNENAVQAAQSNFQWAQQSGDPFVSWLVKRWSSTSTAGANAWEQMENQANYTGSYQNASMFTNPDMTSKYQQGNPFALQMPPLNLSLGGNVNLNVNAGEFNSIFDRKIDLKLEDHTSNLTFDIDSATSFN